VIEYTSAPASVVIAIYGLVNAWKWERDRFLKVLASAALRALIFILPLLAYNYAIYGSPFSAGYNKVYAFPGMREGFYGIRTPDLNVASELLICLQHGILWLSPLLLFVPYALYKQWKLPGQNGIVITIITITLYYIAWNSGYIYWTGGSATGPRFLTPILPFLCLPLAILWSKANKYFQSILIFFFILSFFICLTSVSVTMTLGIEDKAYFVFDYLIPEFIEPGKYRISPVIRMLVPGINGKSHFDLLPLLIIFLVFGLYIFKRKRNFEKQYSGLIK